MFFLDLKQIVLSMFNFVSEFEGIKGWKMLE